MFILYYVFGINIILNSVWNIFMFCKSLRAAAKNDAPCRFLNALVQIPVVKCRKTKSTLPSAIFVAER